MARFQHRSHGCASTGIDRLVAQIVLSGRIASTSGEDERVTFEDSHND
jgi:hypothetical protein